jgi:hypothetical protein
MCHVTAVAAGQSRRLYSGVVIFNFNWYYLSSCVREGLVLKEGLKCRLHREVQLARHCGKGLRSIVDVRNGHSGYSGFHSDPELVSRGEGAPREGSTHGAVGGIVPIVTKSRYKPFSKFKSIDF